MQTVVVEELEERNRQLIELVNSQKAQLSSQTAQISSQTAQLSSQTAQISFLQEQLEWLKRQVFGQRSERMVDVLDEKQLCFEGFEPSPSSPAAKTITTHKRKSPKRKGLDKISLPSDLPVEQVILDIPEAEKICKKTGKPLVKIGEERSYKLACRPASYFLKEIIRPKYATPEGGIITAPMPDSIIARCRADESLLAEILVKKYADHLPLYRVCEGFSREGIGISRQLLSQWVIKLGQGLYPLYKALRIKILESGNVYIDESPINLQAPGKGKCQKAYMWVVAGGNGADPPCRYYDFRLGRHHANAFDILGDYKGGFHSDKYGAYVALAKEKGMIWFPCWSHIRRKFVEAESGCPELRRWILRKIRYLFMLERVAWSRTAEERLKIRAEKEERLVDEITSRIESELASGSHLPKSKLSQALNYTSGLAPYLKNYLSHPSARLDNNVAERAIRPLALGRKNWLFMGSQEGGKAAAVVLSLVQTCRAQGINPRKYLEDVLRRLMSHPANKVSELLPEAWAKSRAASAS